MKKSFWFCLIFSFLIFSFPVFADNWTLGIMEFSFKQNQSRSESSVKAASVLPQLIIEQFSDENIRTIPASESLDRRLKELQTARLALFLQLSKECKARDALVLTTTNPRTLNKSIKTEMEKIHEIENQIEENLEQVKKIKEEFAPKIKREQEKDEDKNSEAEKENNGFFSFPFPFFHKNEKDEIVTESVVLYKSDSTALFKPTVKALEAG
ncbi:hypothetical protein, partial [Treponema sp.]|uniref:hypothetical protein n=1 Tax=Treponema sp. TaxID=166 RepID=UPI00388D66A4